MHGISYDKLAIYTESSLKQSFTHTHTHTHTHNHTHTHTHIHMHTHSSYVTLIGHGVHEMHGP